MSVSVTVFDGADCIGGNKIHLDFDGHGVFLDFGLNYHKLGQYYEEFLNPRVKRGIHDFIHMGLVPNLGCYRHDLIPSDLDMSGARRLKVDAVFLSHAHMDHVGSAGLLDLSIPFISTPVTASLLKGIRDTSISGYQYEASYASIRAPSAEDGRVLDSVSKADYRGRDFLLPCPCPEALRDFSCACPSKSRDIAGGSIGLTDSLGFDTRCFDVDHSIYGASAMAVSTSVGWVVYSGDLRTSGRFKENTERFAANAQKLNPRLLIIEGTRASREDKEDSEAEVKENCRRDTEDEDGLVVADFSARNFERLDTFTEIARETGRQLVVLSKDAYMLDALRYADGMDRLEDLLIYGDLRSKRNGYDVEVQERYEEKFVDPLDIAEDPSGYILALSFYDMGKLLDIKPAGGSYIYSSSEAYSEEQVIDFRRLDAWLRMLGLEVKGFRMSRVDGNAVPEFEPGYHASGHASSSALLRLIETIGPEAVMPVHTENPALFDQLDGIEVIKPAPGATYSL